AREDAQDAGAHRLHAGEGQAVAQLRRNAVRGTRAGKRGRARGEMKGKAAAILLCLAFALPFGGVGAWATYAIATMIYDGTRAQDWVRVKADVIGPSSYRYSFGGATYTGARLDASRFGGTDQSDGFQQRLADLFTAV